MRKMILVGAMLSLPVLPAAAQLLEVPSPAIEGEGTSRQSIDLLSGSISVTLEMSGALAAGAGGASVTVGGGIGIDTPGRDPETTATTSSVPPAPELPGPSVPGEPVVAHGDFEPGLANACPGPGADMLDARDVVALGAGQAFVVGVRCASAPIWLASAIKANPNLASALLQHGIALRDVSAIWRDQGNVFIGRNVIGF